MHKDIGAAILLILVLIVVVAAAVLATAGMWKTFQKAGKPGWAAIVPFYQGWVMAEMGGKPGWWGILASILSFGVNVNSSDGTSVPAAAYAIASVLVIIGFVFGLLISLGVARNFGKTPGFGVLLAFLPFIGYPMLGFGDAAYKEKA